MCKIHVAVKLQQKFSLQKLSTVIVNYQFESVNLKNVPSFSALPWLKDPLALCFILQEH